MIRRSLNGWTTHQMGVTKFWPVMNWCSAVVVFILRVGTEEEKGEAIIFFVFLVCNLWVDPIPCS